LPALRRVHLLDYEAARASHFRMLNLLTKACFGKPLLFLCNPADS
jgi:hypothetical protein